MAGAMVHLHMANYSCAEQTLALERIILADPVVRPVLDWLAAARLADDCLADAWLVSGAVYQAVWNHLTARPAGHGLLDFDIAYHDPRDLSYDAENGVIQRHLAGAVDFAGPVELRNQARVHMWYPEKFGHAYPALDSVEDGLRLYPARTQAVAVRINERKRIEIIAPFGLGPIFSFRFLPNDALPNAKTYSRKAARCLELWPELQVSPWPGRPSVLASGK